LAGLHERLRERLRPEPCQTGENGAAPPLKPDLKAKTASTEEAEPRFRGSVRLRLSFPGLPLAVVAFASRTA
jgi:hypothetical protein